MLEDINLLTDFYTSNQVEKFIENRHDQSIMSLISKTMGCESIANETYFEEFSDKQYLYPFLSVRHYGHGKRDRIKYFINYKNIKKIPIYF